METHLDRTQIEELLQPFSDEKRGSDHDQGNADARIHLSNCEICQARFRAEQEAMWQLTQLSRVAMQPKGPHCPPDTVWFGFVAGTATDRNGEYLRHAAECDHCGPLLREVIECFAEQLNPGEEASLATLESSSPEWQKALLTTLITEAIPVHVGHIQETLSRESPKRPVFPRIWLPVSVTRWPLRTRWALAAGVVVLLTSGFFFMRREDSSVAGVNRLLAQAYSEQRTLELRIPGAGIPPSYRGSDRGRQNHLRSLHAAEDEIEKHLSKSPSDVGWLQARGRSALLEGDYETAITTLKPLTDANPRLTEAPTDLATAYFLRGRHYKNKVDSTTAYSLLSEVLARNPNDLIALFNRAVVEEDLNSFVEAGSDWKRYLRLDPSSAWADEARKHLVLLEESHKVLHGSAMRPAGGSTEPVDDSTMQRDVESNFEKALASWLPLAVGSVGKQTEAESIGAREAVYKLSRLLAVSHQDRWLESFINSGKADGHFDQGVLLIAQSHTANARGDYAEAMRAAAKATAHFNLTGNRAGALLARWENLYATRLSYRAERCSTLSRALWSSLQATSYYWLQSRALLDYAQCAELTNQLQLADRLTLRSSQLSAGHGYPDLHLRALKVSGDLALLSASPSRPFALYQRGLDSFWASNVGYMAGYNLYTGLDDWAQFHGLWSFDASVLREALALAAQDPDVGMHAVLHQRLATALSMSGDTDGAVRNAQEAATLFAKLPDDETARGKLAEVAILMAHLNLLRGQPAQALVRLQTVRSEVQKLANSQISFDFFSTAGLAAEALGHWTEAHQDLEQAIRLAESGLQTITTEHERLLWSRRCGIAYRGMVHLELSRDPAAAFAWWEWYRGASRRTALRVKHAFSVATMYQELQESGRLLRPDTIVLSYAIFPEGIASWTYDGGSVRYKWIAIAPSLVIEESRTFADLCSDPRSDLGTLRNMGRKLYEALVAPVIPLLGQHTHAMVEADDDLDRIPFEVLVNRDGSYLAESYTFGYSTGLFYIAASSPLHAFSAASSVLVVADPTAHPELGLLALPDAEIEARSVAADFPNAVLLLGNEATSNELVTRLRTTSLFHFAGHAIVGGNGAALVLRDPRSGTDQPALFSAADFAHASLRHTALVVLSACSSAQGPEGGLNESESLARSLESSGVPQVIASRWPVESAASSALMQDFYAGIGAGRGAADSLTAAERSLRARAEYIHPFYWAAFSLFGKI